jgi:DNA-binding transcriptional LysR family regulator
MADSMNVKQLEVFIAIVETGSFSKGAERSCLTQSTASQHMAALEGYYGVRLLDRTGRGAMPTEAGKVLLEHARRVMADLLRTEQAIQQFRRAEKFALALAASTIPGTYLVPTAVARLREKHPTVSVTVASGDSAAVQEMLASGLVEAAVLGSPAADRRIDGEAIGHDRIVLVAQATHRWQRISLAELCGEPLVLRENGSGTGAVVGHALRSGGFAPADLTIALVAGSSEAVKQAVLAGCGVAFLSELAVRSELDAGILREIPVAGLSIERTFTLAWRRGRTLSPAAAAFCELVRLGSAQK